jgi:hypothetical protein
MANKSFFTASLSIALTSLALGGCGGGGGDSSGGAVAGGSSTPDGTETYSIITPTKLLSTPALGSANYPSNVTDYGVGTATLVASTARDTFSVATYDAVTSVVFQLYPTTHINSSVTDAWNSGWNGNGVTISIIDDFNTISVSDVSVCETNRGT